VEDAGEGGDDTVEVDEESDTRESAPEDTEEGRPLARET
jgi:hypothetical protein